MRRNTKSEQNRNDEKLLQRADAAAHIINGSVNWIRCNIAAHGD